MSQIDSDLLKAEAEAVRFYTEDFIRARRALDDVINNASAMFDAYENLGVITMDLVNVKVATNKARSALKGATQ